MLYQSTSKLMCLFSQFSSIETTVFDNPFDFCETTVIFVEQDKPHNHKCRERVLSRKMWKGSRTY